MSLLSRLLSFPKRRPVLFGVGFSASKTSFADYLVQRYVEKREEIDLKRNLTFGLFGLGYLGATAPQRRGATTRGLAALTHSPAPRHRRRAVCPVRADFRAPFPRRRRLRRQAAG